MAIIRITKPFEMIEGRQYGDQEDQAEASGRKGYKGGQHARYQESQP
jgi:hypothetical protein